MKNTVKLFLDDLVGTFRVYVKSYGREPGGSLRHYSEQIVYGRKLLQKLKESDIPEKSSLIGCVEVAISHYQKMITRGHSKW